MLELINKFRSKAQECRKKANEYNNDRLRIEGGVTARDSCNRDRWYILAKTENEYTIQAHIYEECANDIVDLFATGGV